MSDRKRPTLEDLDELLKDCPVDVGPGWEKYATHFVDELLELGFSPTHIRSRNGVLEICGDGVITREVAEAIAEKARYLDGRCEFCWLGGTSRAVRGRCDKHRDWLFENPENAWRKNNRKL